MEKSGWLCVLTYTVLNTLFFTWFDKSVELSIELVILEFISFICMYLYSRYRMYDIRSDKHTSRGTFIILKRPKNFLDFLASCIFLPISSISIVSNGLWYGFKRRQAYKKVPYTHDDRHIFIKVNLKHTKVNKILSEYIGTKWKTSFNCCDVLQELFETKFSILDSMPAYMAHKIIRGNHGIKK